MRKKKSIYLEQIHTVLTDIPLPSMVPWSPPPPPLPPPQPHGALQAQGTPPGYTEASAAEFAGVVAQGDGTTSPWLGSFLLDWWTFC